VESKERKERIKIIFMDTTFQVCTTFFRQCRFLSLFPVFLSFPCRRFTHVTAERLQAERIFIYATLLTSRVHLFRHAHGMIVRSFYMNLIAS
jgi:hypothetical protein